MPPGLLRKSRMNLSAPTLRSESRANLTSPGVLLLKVLSTIYPTSSSTIPAYGTDLILIMALVIVKSVSLSKPFLEIVIVTSVPGFPLIIETALFNFISLVEIPSIFTILSPCINPAS